MAPGERIFAMTPKEIFEGKIKDTTGKADVVKKVNATYRFDITGPTGGTWIASISKKALPAVRQADEQAQCTITMADGDFVSLIDGKLNPQMAFMSGKLKSQRRHGLGDEARPSPAILTA